MHRVAGFPAAILTTLALSVGPALTAEAVAGAVPPALRHAVLQSVRGGGTIRAEGSGYRIDTRHLSAQIGVSGISVAAPGAAAPAVSMRFAGLGRGEDVAGVRVIEVGAQADRVSLRYGALTEWYRVTPAGIEQGFTLEQRSYGEGPLVLRLELGGRACGTLTEDERSMRFDLGEGNVLHYDGLAAFDSAGRELEASLACVDGAILIRVDDRDAAYPITVDPLIFAETKLTASDAAVFDYFGRSVALSGDTALVGAAHHDVGANIDQGAAYVFVRSGGIWAQQAQLTASDGAKGDRFGWSVALSGNTALIGATGGGNENRGSAYVFVRSGGIWAQQAQLTAFDGAASDRFGESVALSGNTALVGAAFDAVGANSEQGSAYVFVRSGTTWTQQAKLAASDGTGSDHFGISVALSGDTALVGADRDDGGAGGDQGSAYVFVRSGTNWMQEAHLLPPTARCWTSSAHPWP